MNNNVLSIEVRKVIDKLAGSEIGTYVDTSLTPPDPFRGRGKIRRQTIGFLCSRRRSRSLKMSQSYRWVSPS